MSLISGIWERHYVLLTGFLLSCLIEYSNQTTAFRVNIPDGRWDQQLQVPEFLLGCVVLAVFWDIKWITASLLKLDCLGLSASLFWLHVISCLNPHCKGHLCRFVSKKLFGMHLQKSSSCWHFFRSRMSAGDQSGVEFDNSLLASCLIRSLVGDANAVYLSLQRAVPLRCDFVNDNFSTSGSTARPLDDGNARRFSVPPHAPHPAGALPSPPPVFFPTPLTKSGPWHYLKWWMTWIHLTTFPRNFNMEAYGHCGCFSFQPEGGQTRRRNVERLYAMMNNTTQLLPMVRTVAAPHGPSCDVITFDFVPQLLKLLQNRTIAYDPRQSPDWRA